MNYQKSNISSNDFEQCVKCTVCTVYCPVTAVNPAYPGPKQAGPDGERYRLKRPLFYDEAVKYCLNFKRCGHAGYNHCADSEQRGGAEAREEDYGCYACDRFASNIPEVCLAAIHHMV